MPRDLRIDFTGIEGGAMFVRVPEGDYALKISKIDLKKGKESGNQYLMFQFKTVKGPAGGVNKMVPHSCSLQKQSLWNLRNLIEACGKPVPSKAVKLDLDKMIGWECAGTIIDDEYEGKKKSTISAFFPMEDLIVTSSNGEKAPTGTKAKAKAKEEEAEEEEEAGEAEETDEAEELFS